MELFIAIFLLLVFIGLFILAVIALKAIFDAVFSGPKKVEKGILAALLAIFLFGFS